MSAMTDSSPSYWEESDYFLRFLIDAVPVLLAYINLDLRYGFANSAYADWFGGTRSEIIGKPVKEVIGEEAFQTILPYLKSAFSGLSVTFEQEMPYTDHASRFVHTTFVPHTRNGIVHGLYTAVTDITDRKRAEEQNQRVQEELAVVVTGAQCLLWYADVTTQDGTVLNWKIRFADELALRKFGVPVSSNKDITIAWLQSILPEDRNRAMEFSAHQVRLSKDYSHEYRISRDDGTILWIKEDVQVKSIVPDHWRLFGVITDINSHKILDFERERLLQEERMSARKQRNFLKDVLASVTEGRLHLCDSREDLPEKLAHAWETIPLSEEAGLDTLRKSIENCGIAEEFCQRRWQDLILAAGEAAMNAIVHAGGGTAQVLCNHGGRIQVWIEDSGTGITLENLPKATLKRGFTTADTLGFGMKMMLQVVDRIFLLTGASGTTVVLEQDRDEPDLDWFGQ